MELDPRHLALLKRHAGIVEARRVTAYECVRRTPNGHGHRVRVEIQEAGPELLRGTSLSQVPMEKWSTTTGTMILARPSAAYPGTSWSPATNPTRLPSQTSLLRRARPSIAKRSRASRPRQRSQDNVVTIRKPAGAGAGE
jgi:hypothetical protein